MKILDYYALCCIVLSTFKVRDRLQMLLLILREFKRNIALTQRIQPQELTLKLLFIISGETEVNKFAKIHLILEAKFDDDPFTVKISEQRYLALFNLFVFIVNFDRILDYNLFQPSVAIQVKTSHLICSANQMTGFYVKCNIGLKWVNLTTLFITLNKYLLSGITFTCTSETQKFNFTTRNFKTNLILKL